MVCCQNLQCRRHLSLTLSPRGGAGVDACAAYINHEFERVIYKTVYGFRTTVLNLYMVTTLDRGP